MSKTDKTSIDDLLFKPLVITYGDDKRLIFIYGSDTEVQHRLSPKGKPDKSVTSVIHMLDVGKTVEHGRPIIESCIVSNVKKFRDSIQIVDADEHMEQVAIAHGILQQEMMELSAKMSNFVQAMATLTHIASSSDINKSKGGIVLGTQSTPLASIFYNTVTGNTAVLKKEDIERIGGVIMQVIMNHLSTDLESVDAVKKLKAEIEFKLVDSLPDNMKAGDVNINMESILEEIKKYQGGPNHPDQLDNGE